MAQGGIKFMRGVVADYVAYFLDAEGKGCADHGYYGAGELWNVSAAGVIREGELTPQAYGNWLGGKDPQSGEARGGKVTNGEQRSGVRGYEFGVNVPKSMSIVAAIDPEFGRILMRAQERAAAHGVEVLRRGAQCQVMVDGQRFLLDVDSLEVAIFAHDGSREGDPHHHLHVQVGSKVFAGGKWRSVYGPGLLRSLGEYQAIVGASMTTDRELLTACAQRGLTVGSKGGINEISAEIEELFSKRHVAIEAKKDSLLQDFKRTWGRSPTARELVQLDQLAWSVTRPGKGERELLTPEQIVDSLKAAGAGRLVKQINEPGRSVRIATLDIDAATVVALGLADAREVLSEGQLRAVADEGITTAGGACDDLARASVNVYEAIQRQCTQVTLPNGSGAWITNNVLAAAQQVSEYVTVAGASAQPHTGVVLLLDRESLTPAQESVAEAVAAGRPVVVEGAAGTGKTFALRRGLDARNAAGLNTFALAPSAAAVEQLGDGWTRASTVHGLLGRDGWKCDDAGAWSKSADSGSLVGETLRDAVIVVDEAGMLDLHTMSALTKMASAHGSRIIWVGDDHQLRAVGVAGGFTLATQNSDVIALREAKRFNDPNHADLVARWRAKGEIESLIDDAISAGNVKIHPSEDDAHVALAHAANESDVLVMCPDNASAKRINTLTRAENEAAGRVAESVGIYGKYGEPMGVGDKIQTRLNDRDVKVNNRQQWIIDAIKGDGSMNVHRVGRASDTRTLPAGYVKENVHRADAITVHAAQGATSNSAHALLDSSWTREQAYVALTRGRATNTLHVVASDIDEARGVLREVLHSSDRLRGVALSDAVRSHTVKTPSKETRMLRIARRDEARREAFGGTMGARLAEAVKMPAKQASVQVRLALAKMPWVSPAMLAYLATDTDPSVRGTALREVGERGLITNVTPAGARAGEVAPVVVARDVPTI